MFEEQHCMYCNDPLPVDVELDNPAKQGVLCEECLEQEMERYGKRRVEFYVGENTATDILHHDEDPSQITLKLEQEGIAYLTGGYADLRSFLLATLKRLDSMR